jgi:hypothetical protein
MVDRGDGLLACILSGHGDWEALDDAALAMALETELAMPETSIWHKVIREKRATFSAVPGMHRPDFKTENPACSWPATIPGLTTRPRWKAPCGAVSGQHDQLPSSSSNDRGIHHRH